MKCFNLLVEICILVINIVKYVLVLVFGLNCCIVFVVEYNMGDKIRKLYYLL
jgi:hypothetical protein